MSVYMYAYTFIYARVWVYICTRVGAFCLFVLSNLSTTCACITGFLYTCMRVCVQIGSGVCFSLFMVSAYGSHSRLTADLTLDKNLFSLPFSRGTQVICVCVRVYTSTHTPTALTPAKIEKYTRQNPYLYPDKLDEVRTNADDQMMLVQHYSGDRVMS